MTSLIPKAKAKVISDYFRAIDISKLEIALFVDEIECELAYGEHAQFWAEMSKLSRGCAPETIRGWVNTVKGYQADQLREWTKRGLSFDHFTEAKHIVNWYKPGKTAPQILTECLTLGSPTGGPDSIMTVAEMRDLYVKDGREPFAPKALLARWVDRLCGFRLPDASKQERFVEIAQKFKSDVEELL